MDSYICDDGLEKFLFIQVLNMRRNMKKGVLGRSKILTNLKKEKSPNRNCPPLSDCLWFSFFFYEVWLVGIGNFC